MPPKGLMRLLAKIIPDTSNQFITGLGFLLLLLLATAQFSSNGVVRGGDDNGGSGIGGTGRTQTPTGESGIGGTGFKPFLGLNSENEIEILRNSAQLERAVIANQQSAIDTPLPIPALVPSMARLTRSQDRTLDSSALDISEVIQHSVDVDAAILTQLRTEVLEATKLMHSPVSSEEAPAPEKQAISALSLTWNDVAKLLQDASDQPASPQTAAITGSDLATANYSAEDPARLTRPERIQRPQLPPMQRVSPLQRTAILPPRVQPLRL